MKLSLLKRKNEDRIDNPGVQEYDPTDDSQPDEVAPISVSSAIAGETPKFVIPSNLDERGSNHKRKPGPRDLARGDW